MTIRRTPAIVHFGRGHGSVWTPQITSWTPQMTADRSSNPNPSPNPNPNLTLILTPNLNRSSAVICGVQADRWTLVSFGRFSLPADAHCTGSEIEHAILQAISVKQPRSAHALIASPLVGFGRFVIVAYVDPAYCRCRLSIDPRLRRLV